MAKATIDWKISKDNSKRLGQRLDDVITKVLHEIGVTAVAHANEYITGQSAIDTGLLANSLTYALGGKSPAKRTYGSHKGYHSGRIPNPNTGRYNQKAPPNAESRRTVYVGTNVFYGIYVEMGHRNIRTGRNVPARPFLRPAIENHLSQYREIMESELKQLGND